MVVAIVRELGPLLTARIGWLHVGIDLLFTAACFALVFWKKLQPPTARQ